jgi:carbon monoxide dehydrogenase subunit G
MKFEGQLEIPAPREAVFDRMKDAKYFASCVEGVKDLKEITPTHYTATFETKVAFIKFRFHVEVVMTEAVRPESIAAKIEGKPHGVVGRLSATSAARFEEKNGATIVHYAIEANLTGKLGSIGQPVLKSKAKEMERQFVANMRGGFASSEKPSAS